MHNNIQVAEYLHCSAITLYTHYGAVSLVLRYPNKLHIKSVEECIFFKEFNNFVGERMNETIIAEMKYLKNRIKNYVEVNDLYCGFEIQKISVPVIEIIGV